MITTLFNVVRIVPSNLFEASIAATEKFNSGTGHLEQNCQTPELRLIPEKKRCVVLSTTNRRKAGIKIMSSASNDTSSTVATDAGSMKDTGREGRLSFRHFAENQLRRDFKADAMKKCDLQIGAFAECIKEEGLLAPFKCREIKKDVNECMTVYNSEERFNLYVKDHEEEIENKPFV